jgi:hypothetical protein
MKTTMKCCGSANLVSGRKAGHRAGGLIQQQKLGLAVSRNRSLAVTTNATIDLQ